MTQYDAETLVNQQLTHLGNLEQLLTAELNAVRHRQLPEITQANQQKHELLQQIHATDQQLEAVRSSISASQREQIQTRLLACKKLNLINGRAINMAQAAGHRLRMALGGAETMAAQTYNAKGATNPTPSTHSVGRA